MKKKKRGEGVWGKGESGGKGPPPAIICSDPISGLRRTLARRPVGFAPRRESRKKTGYTRLPSRHKERREPGASVNVDREGECGSRKGA